MSIEGISSRHIVSQAAPSGDVAAAPPAADDTAEQAANDTPTADTPATTRHLSRAGRFLGFLQHLENKHPEEAKKILTGIADRLRHDAERAGPFADRLNTLADRFQKAADTGDLSGLVPSRPGFGHHAVRAYQAAAHDETATAAADLGAAAGAPPAAESGAAATAGSDAPKPVSA